jgi:hypothetical protein
LLILVKLYFFKSRKCNIFSLWRVSLKNIDSSDALVWRQSILTIATLRFRFKGLYFPLYNETFVYFGDFYSLKRRKWDKFFLRRFLLKIGEPSDSLVSCKWDFQYQPFRVNFRVSFLLCKMKLFLILVEFYFFKRRKCNIFFLWRVSLKNVDIHPMLWCWGYPY